MARSRSYAAADAPGAIATLLARDFGAKTALTRGAVAALAGGIAPEAAAAPQLARQTWYLLAVKLLTAEIMAAVHGQPSPAAQWRDADGAGGLRREVEAVEHGPLVAQLRGGDGPGHHDPFAWYLDAWSDEIAAAVRELARRLAEYPRELIVGAAGGGQDLFKPLYEAVFPRTLRHALGEYYTPDWLAEHVLDQVGYPGAGGSRLLDPMCGSGVFLMAAIRRLRSETEKGTVPMSGTGHPGGTRSPFPPAQRILENVVGLELNPLAAITARANYLLAIADLVPKESAIEIPVYRCDAILDEWKNGEWKKGTVPVCAKHPAGRSGKWGQSPFSTFDFVVGNPPWIAWDNLPAPIAGNQAAVGAIRPVFAYPATRPGMAAARKTSPC